MEPIHRIRLPSGKETKLLAGHLWVYRNEVADWPKEVEPGDLADIHDARGKFLARGYLNPRSMIIGRLLARERIQQMEQAIQKEIDDAVAYAESSPLPDGATAVEGVYCGPDCWWKKNEPLGSSGH